MTFDDDFDIDFEVDPDDLSDLLANVETEVSKSHSERCDKVDLTEKYERGKCVEVQEGAVENMVLEIENDQELYNKLFQARGWTRMLRKVSDYQEYWCDRAFRPNAEEELADLRKKTGDQAKDIANGLFAPFLEQFLETPVQVRRDRYNRCNQAVTAAITDFDAEIRRQVKKNSKKN